MTPILNQYKDKQYRVSGKKGTYKITTNFLARTQPSWYVAVQNRLHVVEVKNDDCEKKSQIIFTISEHSEESLAEIMEDIKTYLQ